MDLVPEDATAPVMGEVLQPEQRERAPVAAGEVEVTTEQPEAAGDELLSTDEISGEYSAACACVHVLPGDDGMPAICNSMSVVPLGADVIETWNTGCLFLPTPLFIAPFAFVEVEVRTRNPGTNAFGDMTFSADGTVTNENGCCCCYKKCPGSQKRSFQKVETRDLAGHWCGCCCIPLIWYYGCLLWPICCTRRKALNEDRYAENGICCFLGLPCPVCETRTRIYVNGHPTNGFAVDEGQGIEWFRDSNYEGGYMFYYAQKVNSPNKESKNPIHLCC